MRLTEGPWTVEGLATVLTQLGLPAAEELVDVLVLTLIPNFRFHKSMYCSLPTQ